MADYFAHESSWIDEGCVIGEGTKIWHFSHVMSNSKIGRRCNLGQNVVISPDVRIGDNVKIQNNLHNKGFIFDHATVVVSSMNWSGEGVLNNRDAGVVIKNATAAAYYEKIFLDDWQNHAEQSIA